MNKEEIKKLLWEHLKDLKGAAENCDEENLRLINSAILRTAKLLMQIDDYGKTEVIKKYINE